MPFLHEYLFKIRHRRTVLCDEMHFCRRVCFLFSNLMSESVAVIRLFGYSRSKMRDFSFGFLFRGICTEKSKYFVLVKALFFLDP